MRFLTFTVLLCVALTTTGCSSNSDEPTEVPESVSGRWLLRMIDLTENEGYVDRAIALLELSSSEKEQTAKVLEDTQFLRKITVKNLQLGDTDVSFDLDGRGKMIHFEGKRDGSTIKGNASFGGVRVEPAWLELTENRGIYDREKTPPSEGLEEYIKAEQAGESPFDAAYQFAKKYPKRPLSIMVYRRLTGTLDQQVLSDEKMEKFVQSYLDAAAEWGEHMLTAAQLDVGWELTFRANQPELGVRYLRRADKKLTSSMRAVVGDDIEAAFRRVDALTAYDKALTGEPGALAELQAIHEKAPLEPIPLYTAAEAAMQLQETDIALKLYSRLATWPALQNMLFREDIWSAGDRLLPESKLRELWVRKNQNTRGLAEFQRQVYLALIEKLANQAGPKSERKPVKNHRTSVVEYFTGTSCLPCIAGDMATAAIEQEFPRDEVIVLRYHQHVPSINPLATLQSAQRLNAYVGREMTVPSLAINGRIATFPIKGFLTQAVDVIRRLRENLGPISQEATDLRIRLTAELDSAKRIQTSAQVTGFDDDNADALRLVLVLAEDEIDFNAENGIRIHNLIVRKMLSGVGGMTLVAEEVSPIEQPTVEELRSELLKELEIAEGRAEQLLDEKPMQLSSLWLVGFVQNIETMEILNGHAIPIEGTSASQTVAQGSTEQPSVDLPPLPGGTATPPPSIPQAPAAARVKRPLFPAIPKPSANNKGSKKQAPAIAEEPKASSSKAGPKLVAPGQ
ncbi:hypothetical protein [Thalassoroseus pseudoceratinae]|uniref:hypothetical protein n=1 Tax=Thalassoroseus pseudoceratinae TaxID=2713176 RepID=UPI001424A6D7|nr:hypothetical protein [Thalassoroseus pseudoceratinae]